MICDKCNHDNGVVIFIGTKCKGCKKKLTMKFGEKIKQEKPIVYAKSD